MTRRRLTYPILACLALLWIGLGAGGATGDDDLLNQAATLYRESELKKAAKLAGDLQDEPVGRLILHLCQVHDAENRNIKVGLAGLKTLFEDDTLANEIRAEAALNYARNIQVFQDRKIHPEYDEVDVRAVYDAVMALEPNDYRSTVAAMYIAALTAYDTDPAVNQQALDFLEGFLRTYAGPIEYTVPIHLMLDVLYIELRGDYVKSVEHLKQACDIGLANETSQRECLFRMGRINDLKLGNKNEARRYYRIFLEKYQYARRRPLVERYLQELGEQE